MKKPEIPLNEAIRLDALRALNILDTPGEERFDRITRVARRHFNVPIALVSLIDTGRQWFKSRQGLDASETPRDISFCGHAILSNNIFNIPNALKDERFVDNPLVTGPPGIRFYAGAPLHAPGDQRIGTLCIIDDKPREFSSDELTVLRDLADFVEAELERTKLLAASLEAARLAMVAEQTDNAVIITDAEGVVEWVNKGFERIAGYRLEEIIGKKPGEVLHGPDTDSKTVAFMHEKISAGEAFNTEVLNYHKDGKPYWLTLDIQPVINEGKLTNFIAIESDITERKTVSDELSRFKHALDNTLDMIFMFDNKTLQFNYLNEGAVQSMGYTKHELLQMHPYDIKPEISKDKFLQLIEPLITGQTRALNFETVHRHKNGRDFPVAITLQLVGESDGSERFVAIVHDITERNQAAQKLEEASRLRQAILDSANFTIISTDTEGVIQTFNKGAQELLGYSESEVVGKLTPALFHDADEVVNHAKALSKELNENIEPGFEVFVHKARHGIGVADENQWVYIDKDGNRIPVMLSVTALRSHKGEITGFLGIGSDISERRLAEQEQKNSQNRTRAIFENVIDSIITINNKGLIETANPATVNIFGYNLDEMIGQNVKMLMPAPYHNEHDGYLTRYQSTGEARIIGIGREVIGRRKDGSTFPMELAVSKMDVSGKQMFTGIVRDITERKEAENALRQAKEEAERNNRMKSEFLNMMSHELRTPLTVIMGYLPLMKDEANMPEPAMIATIVGDMSDSASHLLTLINDVLDLSKIEAGKMTLKTECLSSRELVQNVLDNLNNNACNKGIELINETADEDFIVDAVRLKQIFINLVGNAIKFTDHGSIIVSSKKRKDHLEFKVIDTGCGIPEDDLPHIFDKFRQVDSSSTRTEGGTGLGLTITKKLVELHGGRLSVTSQDGAGTIFTFTIRNPGNNCDD